jgi:hypothetical protein
VWGEEKRPFSRLATRFCRIPRIGKVTFIPSLNEKMLTIARRHGRSTLNNIPKNAWNKTRGIVFALM